MNGAGAFAFDLIALDVDGTLLTDSHALTIGVRAAVREAAALGAEIVLCTGRGPSGAQHVLDELGLSGVMITHNGAATVESGSRAVLHRYGIEADALQPFMDDCRRRPLHYDLHTAFEVYVEGLTEEAVRMYGLYGVKPLARRPEDEIPGGLVKLTAYGPPQQLDEAERDWNGWNTPLRVIRSGEFFIDVQHPETGKGSALRALAQRRGVPRERILAIGNYYNDIDMLRFAGTGIAMANSPDEVKAAAGRVTLSNEEDGVAHALRRYFKETAT